jgi:tRNA-Thr(GGU) m(6)t(6)A37 methyltransferase TsaA
MKKNLTMHPIAVIHTDFATKFGIPRQASLAEELKATIVFEKEYRKDGILKGLENFSHIWLLWGFSASFDADWTPTVRPPRLGGTKRVGVFASRSPFRPNPIGLSAVKIDAIRKTKEYGTVIDVIGADMMDLSPIYDIKPYVPYSDRINAAPGFAEQPDLRKLQVRISPVVAETIPAGKLAGLIEVLALDPRPPYQNDPNRKYGFVFAGMEIKFKVEDNVLTVLSAK